MIYLFLASVSLVVLVFLLSTVFADKIKFKTVDIIYAFLSIFFGIPILYLVLKIIFSLLMFWYYILGTALIVLGIMSLFISNVKTYHKIIIIVLIAVTLILYNDYRSILEIKFDVIIR